VWFAVIIGFGLRYLRRQGRLVDRLNAERLAAESRRAAEHARHLTRAGHFRALHDTVLATLVALARGGLDYRDERVRQRCARDAEYVRRLMLDEASEETCTAADRLIEVVTAAEALGLRIHYHRDALPADLPAEAVEAVGEATREALNNVARHAGVGSCWVTATWEDGTMTVRVVDRGQGFDPRQQPDGFGLGRSIRERMHAAGGSARVSAAPGAGTSVELSWPR
jgi:signal transduction histidine kinase